MSIFPALVGEEPRLSQTLSNPGGVFLGESTFQVLQEEMSLLCMPAGMTQGIRQHWVATVLLGVGFDAPGRKTLS